MPSKLLTLQSKFYATCPECTDFKINLLADRAARMIGYWHGNIVCLSVCLSVTLGIVSSNVT